jgi:hypothetical protein
MRRLLDIDLWLYVALGVAVIGVLGVIVWRLMGDSSPDPAPQVAQVSTPTESLFIVPTLEPEVTPTATETATHTPTIPPTHTVTPLPTVTVNPLPLPTIARYYTGYITRLPTELNAIGQTQIELPRFDQINGLNIPQFIWLPDAVQQNVRDVYAYGQSIGRNPRAFSKLGDSTIANPFFMGYFDDGRYNLGAYGYLQPTIDYFSGSFGRESVAVRIGLHTWSVLDPMWAGGGCGGGEHMLACEFRLHNPAFLFIRLGSNDAGVPDMVERSLRRIITYALENGVVPILGTKADRFEGGDNINNNIIRKLAQEMNVPLWDFDVLAGTIVGRGLTADRVHMTSVVPLDYTQTNPLQTGHGVHSLSALMMLEIMTDVVRERPITAFLIN